MFSDIIFRLRVYMVIVNICVCTVRFYGFDRDLNSFDFNKISKIFSFYMPILLDCECVKSATKSLISATNYYISDI